MFKPNDIVRHKKPQQGRSSVFLVQGGGPALWTAYSFNKSQDGSHTAVSPKDSDVIGNLDDIDALLAGLNKGDILEELKLNEVLPDNEMLDLDFLNDGISEDRISQVYSYETLVKFAIKSLIVMKRLKELNTSVKQPVQAPPAPQFKTLGDDDRIEALARKISRENLDYFTEQVTRRKESPSTKKLRANERGNQVAMDQNVAIHTSSGSSGGLFIGTNPYTLSSAEIDLSDLSSDPS